MKRRAFTRQDVEQVRALARFVLNGSMWSRCEAMRGPRSITSRTRAAFRMDSHGRKKSAKARRGATCAREQYFSEAAQGTGILNPRFAMLIYLFQEAGTSAAQAAARLAAFDQGAGGDERGTRGRNLQCIRPSEIFTQCRDLRRTRVKSPPGSQGTTSTPLPPWATKPSSSGLRARHRRTLWPKSSHCSPPKVCRFATRHAPTTAQPSSRLEARRISCRISKPSFTIR